MTVLVIDDDQTIQLLARKILDHAGHEVILCSNGWDGIEELDKNPDAVAVVLIDYSMEELSGVDTLRRLRRLVPDLPAVFSSGNPMSKDDIPSDLVDFTSFLPKPYRVAALVEAIEDAAGKVSVAP